MKRLLVIILLFVVVVIQSVPQSFDVSSQTKDEPVVSLGFKDSGSPESIENTGL